ncbi:MAG: hypothetical protein HYT37_02380 [Candidatus Sungbacteria bacterium]|nr:hypothetical protein [Candidatus Sungbacteria bacterium]
MALDNDPNFGTLESGDDYAQYFNLLANAFTWLLACYSSGAAETYEADIVPGFLRKMLYTIETLRVKYTYGSAYNRSLWVDLTDSGFPNSQEVTNIVADILGRKERLRALPAKSATKGLLLDTIFSQYEAPREMLWQLSEREYLEMLDEEKLFLSFTPGELINRDEDQKYRNYIYSWACYDFRSNRPYIHLMTFDQDKEKQPLEEKGASYYEFLQVVKGEGSRAPDVAILAIAIDEALESIHPTVLKRLCIGPLYGNLLLSGKNIEEEDVKQSTMRSLLSRYSRAKNDFMLFSSDDIVFSKSRQTFRGILNPRGKVREIFAITETDPECYARHASVINHYCLLPHWVLQNIDPHEIGENLPEFNRCQKITYNDRKEVEIHGRG